MATNATGDSKLLAKETTGSSEVEVCSPDPREGVILSWDRFELAFTSREAKESSAKLTGTGLQLLSVCDGCPGYLVPPTILECSLTQHRPSSALDTLV